jgi:FKBP-type peptidyl-prolyl cis-trans isomerase SlpA
MIMTELNVGPGTQVTLHFAVRLDDGSIVDSTFDSSPATFVVGDRNLLEGFERLLFGLSPGDKNSFDIVPEQGFGQHNPNNVQEIPRTAFDETIELSEGLLVSFADASNKELPGIVQTFDDYNVTVDFNHPLAGRNLIFDVEIIAVEPAVTH